MYNKILLYLVLPVITIGFAACTSSSSQRCDEARSRAQKAAQALIETDHSDSTELQHKILDAKAIQSEYALSGDSAAVRAFDESFRQYMIAHDDTLAQSIF